MGGVVRTKEVYIIMWIFSLTLGGIAESVTVVCVCMSVRTRYSGSTRN